MFLLTNKAIGGHGEEQIEKPRFHHEQGLLRESYGTKEWQPRIGRRSIIE